MQRYVFNAHNRARRSRLLLVTLSVILLPRQLHATHSPPDLLMLSQLPDTTTTDVLSAPDIENGVRLRLEHMQRRQEKRRARRSVMEPSDYRVDQPPLDADIPPPPDAPGGDVSEELEHNR
jgi:hypothetical protein